MKQIFSIILTAAIALSFASCKQWSYEKTKSGLRYKIFHNGGKDTLKAGDIIKFHVAYEAVGGGKDTMLNNSFPHIPAFAVVDTSARGQLTFMELLTKCVVGDSIVVSVSVDTLKSKGFIRDYDRTFVKGGQIRTMVKILKKLPSENEAMKEYEAETKAETEREIIALGKYLEKNNIKATKTKSGVYVVIETPGSDSIKADSGMVATVMYKGYLQSDNKKVFDTNMDSSKGHTDPLPVNVGTGSVIKGWDEALPYFSKGSKGKIYIPSMLAYGPQGNPEIPAFSNLVFDIEVKDVTKATPPPPPPAAPVTGNIAPAPAGRH